MNIALVALAVVLAVAGLFVIVYLLAAHPGRDLHLRSMQAELDRPRRW